MFFIRKWQIWGRIWGPHVLGQKVLAKTEKNENNQPLKSHWKFHDQNPRWAPGETRCQPKQTKISTLVFLGVVILFSTRFWPFGPLDLAVGVYVSWFLSPKRIMQNHVKSWQIMQKSCPWFCLILHENAWKSSLRMAESGWKCLMPWCPENPRTTKHKYVFNDAERCREPLWRFCQSSGPETQMNPVNGQRHRNPKDPAVLKILRRSKFTLCSKFTSAQWFTIAAHLVQTPFSWELQTFFLSKKGLRRSKSGGRSKNTTA